MELVVEKMITVVLEHCTWSLITVSFFFAILFVHDQLSYYASNPLTYSEIDFVGSCF